MGIFVALLMAAGLGALTFRVLKGRFSDPVPVMPLLGPATLPAPPEEEKIVIYWTKASIILAKAQDPYNPPRRNRGNVEGSFYEDKEAGMAWSTFRGVVNQIPIAAQVIGIGILIVNVIDYFWKYGEGGWEKLPKLVRDRINLYKLHITEEEGQRPQRLQFQDINLYNAAIWNWFYKYFKNSGKRIEWERIVNTPNDEAMLPAVVINYLAKNNLWPPPIEPLPLSAEELRKRYGFYLNRRYQGPNRERDLGWYLDGLITNVLWPPSMDPKQRLEDFEIAKKAHLFATAEYEQTAVKYAEIMRDIEIPDELLDLAMSAGGLPRFGSLANPRSANGLLPAPSILNEKTGGL